MTTWAADTFTDADDTPVGDHAPDTGTLDYEFDSDGILGGGRLSATSFGASLILYGPQPDADDYTVEGMLTDDADGNDGIASLFARASDSGFISGYRAGYWSISDDPKWEIVRVDSHTDTTLVSDTAPPLAGTTRHLQFTVNGDALELRVDGDVVLSTTDSTYAEGKAGLLTVPFLRHHLEWDDFAVADSESDPGVHVLSGRGSVSIDGPLFLSTAMAGIGGTVSYGAAEPPNWYHVGMLSWGTENGVMTAYPITRELDLVQLPAGMTALHYEFAAGITATITELAAP